MDVLAQDVFEQEMDARERSRRANMIDRMMNLWRSSAEEYRVLPLKYLFLRAEKRAANMALHAPSGKLTEYPAIPFFDILNEDMARVWLETKKTSELEYELYILEYTLGQNYYYKSLKTWVSDANYKLSHRKKAKLTLMMSV